MGKNEAPNEDRRGVLYPERLPRFSREPAEPGVAHAIRWCWIPEWDLPPGVESRQEILPFPACNLVIEPHGVSFVGPPTHRSERVLSGSGWAVGALLRPAAAVELMPNLGNLGNLRGLRSLRDATAPVKATALCTEVTEIMNERTAAERATAERTTGERAANYRERAATAVSRWVLSRVPPPPANSEAHLANQLSELLADPTITRVAQLAPLLHTSTRTLQRVAEHRFGLSLHSMIRRRRLQEAADRLRNDPAVQIATVASDLGYADHAHFTTDFTAVIGVTPSVYRYRSAARRSASPTMRS